MFDGEITRISCSCHGEEIAISYDKEWGIDLAFWAYGHRGRGTPLSFKVKSILHILTHGHPYTDMVILDAKEAEKLHKALGDILERIRAEEAEGASNGADRDTEVHNPMLGERPEA
jgi:hypothetical protein